MKKIVSQIWQMAYKAFLKKRKQLKLGSNVYINRNCEFEGFNFLSNNCSIFDTHMGFASYIGERGKVKKTHIGKYSSIGPDFKVVFGNHPTKKFVSTHPVFFSTLKQIGFTYTSKQLFEEFKPPLIENTSYSIKIGNDVWIGASVSILDGVTIGNGAIVATNALVAKDVKPYSIVGGVPAKHIKFRFTESQINFLQQFCWWDRPQEWVANNAHLFTDIEIFMQPHKHVNDE